MSSPFKQLDHPINHATLLCRGCLAESGEMKNMYEWGIADDFFMFTNVQVTLTESSSGLLCSQCEEMLQTCKKFRQQCQNSDDMLRNMLDTKVRIPEPLSPAQTTSKMPINDNTIENFITCVLNDKKLILIISAPNTESKIHLPCPFDCKNSFIKKKDLLAHFIKQHNKNNDFSLELRYFCSFPNCSYYVDSEKNNFFTERKFLNQHYVKVHKSKDYYCIECTTSFSTEGEFRRHLATCNTPLVCECCSSQYKTRERLLVHTMRKHPELHKKYKDEKKKRKSQSTAKPKKVKTDTEKLSDFMCDSPKRSFATQTLDACNVKNDVTLPSWGSNSIKRDEISTQTVLEDVLSLKSQTSEDDSIFFPETVSLSDIQTQTIPLEFGLSRCNKETITSETQLPELNIKETQTCVCLFDSPKPSFKLFDSFSSSPASLNLTSTETQTADIFEFKHENIFTLNSTETQTCFDGEENM